MLLPDKFPHPNGELTHEEMRSESELQLDTFSVDTFNGKLHIEWNPNESTTMLGLLPFFIEFLKLGNLFSPWVEECPLQFKSNNASSKLDLLGTIFLSTLAGHKRYAHITAIRNDGVSSGLLGMKKILSEDSVRRGLAKIEEKPGNLWLKHHLKKSYLPLLGEPWILDIDNTVKPLYGKQEAAVVGYNPHKPGRPSHTYHTYFIANLRLVLDVEVQAGNHTAGSFSSPGLWDIIDKLPLNMRPAFIRGDCAFGTENIMLEAESRNMPYLFKLKQTKKVKDLIKKLMGNGGWEYIEQGWEGQAAQLQLTGWSKARKVVILRKQLKADYIEENLLLVNKNAQQQFDFGYIETKAKVYEFAVLVTDLEAELITINQHYRDRADSENVFDEMKNQWGWGGYTTSDLHRCSLMAKIVALIFNWWNLFVRLANPDKHLEAITSRPLLLHSVAKQTTHANQNKLSISCQHGKLKIVKMCLTRIYNFFSELKSNAEQLTKEQLWYRILSKALEKFLKGRQLAPPIYLT